MQASFESHAFRLQNAGIAQLVEHDLAKVGVASSSLVSRSSSSRSPDSWSGLRISGRDGWVAEWSCSGLQSRVRRFDSDPSLHYASHRVPHRLQLSQPSQRLQTEVGEKARHESGRRRLSACDRLHARSCPWPSIMATGSSRSAVPAHAAGTGVRRKLPEQPHPGAPT